MHVLILLVFMQAAIFERNARCLDITEAQNIPVEPVVSLDEVLSLPLDPHWETAELGPVLDLLKHANGLK